MNQIQKELVQKTWIMVEPNADTAAEIFYGRLFEQEPAFKAMFKSDMSKQGKMLMKTISLAVAALDDVEPLVPVLKNLGARHAAYGVKDSDYEVVGSALLWTLKKGLGDNFTPEVKNAWTEVYDVLASVMKEGVAETGSGSK